MISSRRWSMPCEGRHRQGARLPEGRKVYVRGFLILFPLALLLLAGGMAAHAILEIGDAFLPVLALRLCPVMFVTVIAGVGRKRLRVAGLARARATLSVVRGEAVGPIVACWRPGRGRVARRALTAQHAAVESWILVARGTILWRTLVDAIKMTLPARRLEMCPCQREGGLVVVKGGLLPGRGRVAGGAVPPELAIVGIVGLVAGETILGRALQVGDVLCALVATGAGEKRVLA
jgi:hypothetical protein